MVLQRHRLHGKWGCVAASFYVVLCVAILVSCLVCIFVLCTNADSSCFWPAVSAARSSCRCICIRRPNSQTGHLR